MKQFIFILFPLLAVLSSCSTRNSIKAVDLGLSVKWANVNIGAPCPDECGDCFAWGETTKKAEHYKWADESNNFIFTKYNYDSGYGVVDYKIKLDPEDDVASVRLGSKWRMPTKYEIEELIATRNNADYRWEWKRINGHDGWDVVYLVNRKSIFLPATCRYWSSSLNTKDPAFAVYMELSSEHVFAGGHFRWEEHCVRPVCE